jgi:hypothetical protein
MPEADLPNGTTFYLRLLAHNKLIKNPLKLRNPSIRSGQALKVAATCPNYIVRAGINRSI